METKRVERDERWSGNSQFEIRNSQFQEGFTLIELIIVITIIGMASGVVVAVLSHSLATRRLEASAWALGSALKQARVLSVQTGIVHRLRVDVAEGRYWVEKAVDRENREYQSLPAGVGVSDVLPEQVHIDTFIPAMDPPQVEFDATGGTACAVRLVLKNKQGEAWTVAMSAVSGRLFVLEGEADPFNPASHPELALEGAVTDLPEAVSPSAQ